MRVTRGALFGNMTELLLHREANRLDSMETNEITGHSMKDQEKQWRAEFEKLGEQLVYENVRQGAIYNDERKRQAAFRWLSDQASERRKREGYTLWYVKWTFYAAIIAAVLGLIGIAVALMTTH